MPPHKTFDNMIKYYKIADFFVQMETFGRTEKQAEKYICESIPKKVDIIISPETEKLKNRFPYVSASDIEYVATARSFHDQLLRFNATMLHSSAVVKDGKAYLFTASSGTGKSTHTALWKTVFGQENVVILNDDKPVIRKNGEIWSAYGTPWSGKTAENSNMCVPIGGICLLSRGENNVINRCAGVEAIQNILMQIPKPTDAKGRAIILELLDEIISEIPIWKLQCNMEQEAAIISYEAMSGMRWCIGEK